MLYEQLKNSTKLLRVQCRHHAKFAQHRLQYHRNRVTHRLRGAVPAVHFLQVSSGEPTTDEHQFDPLWYDSTRFCKRLGVVVRHVGIEEALRLSPATLERSRAVGFQFFFRTPSNKVSQFISTLRSRCSSRTKLIYFDGEDDLGISWPQILPQVDLYVKNQVMVDRAFYLRSTIGKSNLTDYVAKHYGTSFESNEVPRSIPVVDKADLDKIFVGWNLGASKFIYKQFKKTGVAPEPQKDIDACCRVAITPGSWLTPLRETAIREATRLAGEYRIVATTDHIPPAQFQDELSRSRICVSPFGHGEICFRDFEAVLHGCLLVKPEMSHLESRPDIYVAGETYVPVRWDFADLADKCRYYLEHETERARITRRAAEVFRQFHDNHTCIDIFAQILNRLGISSHGDGTAV